MKREELLHRLTNKQNFIKRYYGEYVEEWKTKTDDRGLYCIIYNDIMEALGQLKQLEECSDYLYFEVIWPKINEDKKAMEEIKNYFLHERVNTDTGE